MKKWAEGDFKDDPQLDLIPTFYRKLKSEGHDFTDNTTPPKTAVTFSKDPNVVSSQQEQDDIAKAIEMSLKETAAKSSPKNVTQSGSSLYPSVSMSSSISSSTSMNEPRKVRALYDFEAAEDNELTFTAGDIIHVTDDSDQNWWKGYTKKGGEGLFPSNFVTADLSVEPESLRTEPTKKNVQFSDDQKEKQNQIQLDVDENKIDRLMHLLNEANPEDPSQDTEEMLILENQVNQMGPLIDAELERVDRKHAQLTQLSSELVDAINLYHTLMRESDRPNMPYNMAGYQNPQMYGGYQPIPNMYMAPGTGVNFNPTAGMMPIMSIPHGMAQNSSIPGYVMPGNHLHGHNGMLPQQNGHMNPNIPQIIGQMNPQQHPPTMMNTNFAVQQLPIQGISQNVGSTTSSSTTEYQQQQQQQSMPMNNGQQMSSQPHNMQSTPITHQQLAPSLQQTIPSHHQPQQQPQHFHSSNHMQQPHPHLNNQLNNASPVHQPSLQQLNHHQVHHQQHYMGSVGVGPTMMMQTTVLPQQDSTKTNNIPIYQTQR